MNPDSHAKQFIEVTASKDSIFTTQIWDILLTIEWFLSLEQLVKPLVHYELP